VEVVVVDQDLEAITQVEADALFYRYRGARQVDRADLVQDGAQGLLLAQVDVEGLLG
jgi:hypothetical protein